MKMNQTDHIRNFESIAVALHDEAQTERARLYIESLKAKILNQGPNWIDAHCDMLKIHDSAEQLEKTFPVEDNRLWFIEQWQIALMEKTL